MTRTEPAAVSETRSATRPRRSQASRSEQTRKRVIDAAIYCLHRFGYAATSTVTVAERANVSRGAMLHHFPTKISLMIAVAREVVIRGNATRRQMIIAHPRGLDRFAAITDAAWATTQEPAAMTLLEILMASRGDIELAEQLRDVIRELEASQIAGVLEVAHDVKIHQDRIIEAMSCLHQAAMRGLSIDLLSDNESQKVADAFLLLKWYKKRLTESLVTDSELPADLRV